MRHLSQNKKDFPSWFLCLNTHFCRKACSATGKHTPPVQTPRCLQVAIAMRRAEAIWGCNSAMHAAVRCHIPVLSKVRLQQPHPAWEGCFTDTEPVVQAASLNVPSQHGQIVPDNTMAVTPVDCNIPGQSQMEIWLEKVGVYLNIIARLYLQWTV